MKPPPSQQPGPLLYNPALLSRDDLIASFVVRTAELEQILDQLRAALPGHVPQHQLVLGWRGMGKTTLLHRVAYAVEDDEALSQAWLPVLFDEEQFNIGELADFWLNALEMLSEATGETAFRRQAEELPGMHRDEALEEAAFSALKEAAARLNRRLILLVDNVDLVLGRLGLDREASRLREVLQHEPWLMLVGTSSRAIEATYDYDQPFYEMFRVVELGPLDEAETLRLLGGLADRYQAPQVREVIEAHPEKVRKLKLLMGGNPRTVALLFGVLQEGPGGDLWNQLERLLDGCTSLYKDRLESLPVQAQRVFDALAQHWDPATAEALAERLRIDRGAVSGQLHRLVDRGLVEKVKIPGRALGFQVRERFFNIWCLMRGGRRSRQRLRWLVSFIDLFYDAEQVRAEVEQLKDRLLGNLEGPTAERLVGLAGVLGRFVQDPEERAELYEVALTVVQLAHLGLNLVDIDDVRSLVLAGDLPGARVTGLLDVLEACGVDDSDLSWKRVDILSQEWDGPRSESAREMLAALKRHAEQPEPNPRVHWGIAYVTFYLHRFDEALAAAELAVNVEPENPAAWLLLGNVALAIDDVTKARQAIKRACALSPDQLVCILSLMAVVLCDRKLYRNVVYPNPDHRTDLPRFPTSNLYLAFYGTKATEEGLGESCESLLREFGEFFSQPVLLVAAATVALWAGCFELAEELVSGAVKGGMDRFQAVLWVAIGCEAWGESPAGRPRVGDFTQTVLGTGDGRRVLLQLAVDFIFGRRQQMRHRLVAALQQALPDDDAEVAQSLALLAEILVEEGEAEVLVAVLDQTGWDQRVEPLRHALAVLTKEDPARLERLAPETRTLVEGILQRMQEMQQIGLSDSVLWEDAGPSDYAERHDDYLYGDE